MGRTYFRGPMKIGGDLEIASSSHATGSLAAGQIVISEKASVSAAAVYIAQMGAAYKVITANRSLSVSQMKVGARTIVNSAPDIGFDSIGGHVVSLTFKEATIVQNSSLALTTAPDTNFSYYVMPRGGSVVAMCVANDNDPAKGTCSWVVTQSATGTAAPNTVADIINGTSCLVTLGASSTNLTISYQVFTKDSFTFAAGSTVGVKRSANANWSESGASANSMVTLFVEF